MGDGVTLVSSAEETAKDVYALLVAGGAGARPRLPGPGAPLPDDGRPSDFREIGRRFLGPELDLVDQFAWVGV